MRFPNALLGLALISCGAAPATLETPSEPATQTEPNSAAPAVESSPPAPEPSEAAAPPPAPCVDDDADGCKAKCDAGQLESCVRLALLYEEGNAKVQKNVAEARRVLGMACDAKFARACFRLASNLELMPPTDPKKAAVAMKQALPPPRFTR